MSVRVGHVKTAEAHILNEGFCFLGSFWSLFDSQAGRQEHIDPRVSSTIMTTGGFLPWYAFSREVIRNNLLDQGANRPSFPFGGHPEGVSHGDRQTEGENSFLSHVRICNTSDPLMSRDLLCGVPPFFKGCRSEGVSSDLRFLTGRDHLLYKEKRCPRSSVQVR